MKKSVTIIIAIILLIVNYLAGVILTGYDMQNVQYGSLAIVITAVLVLLTSYPGLKTGFRVSLPFVFIFIGIILFFLGVFADLRLENNVAALIAIILVALELAILGVSYVVSKSVK